MIRASKRIFKPESKVLAAAKLENQSDYIGMNDGKQSNSDELEKLRTENKRLKRTLMERFDDTFQ